MTVGQALGRGAAHRAPPGGLRGRGGERDGAGEVAAVVGETGRCTIAAQDGEEITVTIRITVVEGDEVYFEIEE